MRFIEKILVTKENREELKYLIELKGTMDVKLRINEYVYVLCYIGDSNSQRHYTRQEVLEILKRGTKIHGLKISADGKILETNDYAAFVRLVNKIVETKGVGISFYENIEAIDVADKEILRAVQKLIDIKDDEKDYDEINDYIRFIEDAIKVSCYGATVYWGEMESVAYYDKNFNRFYKDIRNAIESYLGDSNCSEDSMEYNLKHECDIKKGNVEPYIFLGNVESFNDREFSKIVLAMQDRDYYPGFGYGTNVGVHLGSKTEETIKQIYERVDKSKLIFKEINASIDALKNAGIKPSDPKETFKEYVKKAQIPTGVGTESYEDYMAILMVIQLMNRKDPSKVYYDEKRDSIIINGYLKNPIEARIWSNEIRLDMR